MSTARIMGRGLLPLGLLGWLGSLALHGGAVAPLLFATPEPPPVGEQVQVSMQEIPQELPGIAPSEVPAQELAETLREATIAPTQQAETVETLEPAAAEPPPPLAAVPPADAPPVSASEPPPPVMAEAPPEASQAALPPDPTLAAEAPEQEVVAVTPPPPPPPPPQARPQPTRTPQPARRQAPPADIPPDARLAQDSVRSGGPLVAAPDAPPPMARPTPPAAPPAGYANQLLRALDRHKNYPYAARARRIEGVGRVTVTIDAKGNVLDYRIVQSAGSEMLDEAIKEMVQRASPLPAPPMELPEGVYRFTAPINFNLR